MADNSKMNLGTEELMEVIRNITVQNVPTLFEYLSYLLSYPGYTLMGQFICCIRKVMKEMSREDDLQAKVDKVSKMLYVQKLTSINLARVSRKWRKILTKKESDAKVEKVDAKLESRCKSGET